jgi:hypothetical protein
MFPSGNGPWPNQTIQHSLPIQSNELPQYPNPNPEPPNATTISILSIPNSNLSSPNHTTTQLHTIPSPNSTPYNITIFKLTITPYESTIDTAKPRSPGTFSSCHKNTIQHTNDTQNIKQSDRPLYYYRETNSDEE